MKADNTNKQGKLHHTKTAEISIEKVAQYSGSEVGKIQPVCWKQPHEDSITPIEILNY
jgi:hypothetical protein